MESPAPAHHPWTAVLLRRADRDFDTGLAKPDPEIYWKAIRELGIEPATTVYVGDGGNDELAGAERAGLRAFRAAWFSRSVQGTLNYPVLSTCEELRAHLC